MSFAILQCGHHDGILRFVGFPGERCGKPNLSQMAMGSVEKGDVCKRNHRKGR
jgi:hypothetical protein